MHWAEVASPSTACNLHPVSWANSVRSGHLADTPRTSAECPRLKAVRPAHALSVPARYRSGDRLHPNSVAKALVKMRWPDALAKCSGQPSWPTILATCPRPTSGPTTNDFAQGDLAHGGLGSGGLGSRHTGSLWAVVGRVKVSRRFGWQGSLLDACVPTAWNRRRCIDPRPRDRRWCRGLRLYP